MPKMMSLIVLYFWSTALNQKVLTLQNYKPLIKVKSSYLRSYNEIMPQLLDW